VTQDPADTLRQWGAFDPGNVGSYPGRVERIVPGSTDTEILDIAQRMIARSRSSR